MPSAPQAGSTKLSLFSISVRPLIAIKCFKPEQGTGERKFKAEQNNS